MPRSCPKDVVLDVAQTPGDRIRLLLMQLGSPRGIPHSPFPTDQRELTQTSWIRFRPVEAVPNTPRSVRWPTAGSRAPLRSHHLQDTGEPRGMPVLDLREALPQERGCAMWADRRKSAARETPL